MTDTVQKKACLGLLLSACLLAGVILGVGATWERQTQRIIRLEDDIREVRELRTIIVRIDRSLAGIEQMTRDYGRRLDRLESRQ